MAGDGYKYLGVLSAGPSAVRREGALSSCSIQVDPVSESESRMADVKIAMCTEYSIELTSYISIENYHIGLTVREIFVEYFVVSYH